jgi:hypothetical protein
MVAYGCERGAVAKIPPGQFYRGTISSILGGMVPFDRRNVEEERMWDTGHLEELTHL